MKHIQKGQEPIQFVSWKEQEKDALTKFISESAKGEAIWEYFPNSCPSVENQEEGIIYYSKKELKEYLLQEQGFICCYCNQSIKNDHNTILEHLQNKSSRNTLTLEYQNLLASCNGGQKDPKPKEIHCDANKGNNNLQLSPLDELSELQLYFSIDGKIYHNCEKGEQAITILNLGNNKLTRLRKKAIEGFIFDENLEIIDDKYAEEILNKIYKKSKEGKFIEFCSAIKSVIQRDILNKNDFIL